MSNDVESGLSPLQKFVLRNWGLLGQDKIAAYLGIKPVLAKKIWASLGLPQRKPFKGAVKKAGRNYREENIRDYNICHACLLHLLSVANYSEFITLRNKLLKQPGNARVKSSFLRILKDEDKNARTMLKLVKKDSRIGYEGSYGYFYTPVELIEKIFDLRWTQKVIKKRGG